MTGNPQVIAPTTEAGTVQQVRNIATGARWTRRIAWIALIVVALFAGTYAIAWTRANSLTTRFLADADASYAEGNYAQALTGYEEFDPETNAYVTRGGYMKVARIWADQRAWPRPAAVDHAQARIDEILNQRLTIAEAEAFIQRNIGQRNPYIGAVYLRLGELYEEEGDLRSAREIYEEVPSLFPTEPDLIARAEQHLARLEGR